LFSDLTEKGLEFSTFFWVSDPDQKGRAAEGVRARALQMLKDTGIRVSRREVFLKEGKAT
jgi:small-conductance mechanosensitive channel